MDILSNIHRGSMNGLSVLVYAAPKTGKTAMLRNMNWEKTLLLDFDTDGHLTLTSRGIKISVISFALLNSRILRERLAEKFPNHNENDWLAVCSDLLDSASKPREAGSMFDFANEYRKTMIGEVHMPFFIDGPKLMGGSSKIPVLDKIAHMCNFQIKDQFDTIVIDNISKLKALITEAYSHWSDKGLSQQDHWAINKRLKSFDMDIMNIKSSGKTIVVMAWMYHKDIVTGKDAHGNDVVSHLRLPDVGGSWSESYAGDFSLCIEACKEEFVAEGQAPQTIFYATANNKTLASRVFALIGDECFRIKKEDGTADRSKPYLEPDLNLILESIKRNSKENQK